MLITVRQYAERHGVPAKTVASRIRNGHMQAQKLGGRLYVDSACDWVPLKVRRVPERFSVGLTEETALAVGLEAERRGMPVTVLLRQLIEEGVKEL